MLSCKIKKVSIATCIFMLLAIGEGFAEHEESIEIWKYNHTGFDNPKECDANELWRIYPDESLSEYCYCKIIPGEIEDSYLWCQLDGGGCGTSSSCD